MNSNDNNALNNLPLVSMVIPTFNSARVIEGCLKSIISQDYPRDRMEIVIADAGSSDRTLDICRKYGVDIITDNPLLTGEAGKTAGIDKSTGEIIALIDSDNMLVGADWLTRMVAPFIEDSGIPASEVLFWSYNPDHSLVDRYCELTGINDPVCMFLGNYDRWNHLTGRWTGYPVTEEKDRGDWLDVTLDAEKIPTMGANGFLIRRKILDGLDYHPYFIDIDIVPQMVKKGCRRIARPKIGIIHFYCDSMATFRRKQRRRIRDFIYFSGKKMRGIYRWKLFTPGFFRYIIYTILVIPLFLQSLRGYLKIRDTAWFFHPAACWITLWEYTTGTISGFIKREFHDRKGWRQ